MEARGRRLSVRDRRGRSWATGAVVLEVRQAAAGRPECRRQRRLCRAVPASIAAGEILRAMLRTRDPIGFEGVSAHRRATRLPDCGESGINYSDAGRRDDAAAVTPVNASAFRRRCS